MNKYSDNFIKGSYTIKEALAALNNLKSNANFALFVLDESERLVGTLTDGDLRRAIVSGKELNETVEEIMYRDFRFVEENNLDVRMIKKFREDEIEMIPVLNSEQRIVKIIDLNKSVTILPVDAVIMAGGLGKRLGPLSASVPKPLLEIGDRTILERGIDRLTKFGITNVHLSVNHHADKIKDHCGDGSAYEVDITYVEEQMPLGTIGSVTLIEEFKNDYVLVMNSDLLTNINLEDMLLTLLDEKADMAVASIPYKVKVPYAILELVDNTVKSFKEKPTFTYYSNGGIYLMKREVLDLIPNGVPFNATDLMEKVVETNGKLISFPVLGYWLDIGRPEDYEKAQQDIKHLKL